MTKVKEMMNQEEFIGYYLLKELEIKQTNNTPPKDYMDIVLSDATGQISAKLWDVSSYDKETFFRMGLVKVKGIAHTYRERLQVKIIQMRPVKAEEGITLTDFISAAPIPSDQLVDIIKMTTDQINDDIMRGIVQFCLDKIGDKLAHYPAAKSHHHNYFGGLAYHTARMLELGKFLTQQRPFLNKDLLLSGIILHDIAKPEEMLAEYGIVSEYSTPGKLIGHIAMVATWITEAAIKLDIDLASNQVLALQHLVLSHHNLGEWGSPVQPQLPEAVALHHIDALDAKLQMVEDALGALPEHEVWTPLIRGLENKPVYRMRFSEDES
ncbi:3'-5' exoribonuclease [Paenibacillus turicensis]|uniref:3'-5' exoribonuclease n=1 Tax=Paenibacillus turicensis TaxID=160487 RepID=A0ABS4FQE0_9BACL|nr:HD domain-containing protein [Paenibacillus turicensis]MBP1904797.1 3'-5' exoribonuclease [Paenibacillus turicensis]